MSTTGKNAGFSIHSCEWIGFDQFDQFAEKRSGFQLEFDPLNTIFVVLEYNNTGRAPFLRHRRNPKRARN
jgi:hypothetical protein